MIGMVFSQDIVISDPDMFETWSSMLGTEIRNAILIGGVQLALGHRFNTFSQQLLFVMVRSVDARLMDQLAALKAVQPGARIVLLATGYTKGDCHRAERTGIDGVLPLCGCLETSRVMLDKLRSGDRVFALEHATDGAADGADEDVTSGESAAENGKLRPPPMRELTEADCEILTCLMEGLPNKLIARRYDVSEATVKIRLRSLLRKLGVTNRTQAAIWALDNLAFEN